MNQPMKTLRLTITRADVRKANKLCRSDDVWASIEFCPTANALRRQRRKRESISVGSLSVFITGRLFHCEQKLEAQILRWVETRKFRPGTYVLKEIS